MIKKVEGFKPSANHFIIDVNGKDVYFDTYRVTSGDPLGFHDYTVIVDDAVDMSFKDRPDKELQLELQWSSTIENINPNKTIIVGTRKFMGDFYDYIMDMYDDLETVILTPFNEDDSLLCPEKWTYESLEKKKKDIGLPMWWAEYMQNPKPMEGGDWDEVHYGDFLGYTAYETACIGIDRATTKNKTSDFTGFVVILKEKGKNAYLVYRDLTARKGFEELKELVRQQYDELRRSFVDLSVVVVLEKQGGGDDLYDSARSNGDSWTTNCKMFHSSRPKEDKIRDALGTAEEISGKKYLKNVKFVNELKKSQVIEQVRTFPSCLAFYDDAIDALSMGLSELEKNGISEKIEKWRFY